MDHFILGDFVWFLGQPNDDKFDSLQTYRGRPPFIAVMMFTDEHLAQQAIEQHSAGLSPVKIPADIALLGLITILERKGCTHVVVDQSFGKGQFHSIAQVKREIAAWFDSDAEPGHGD